MLGKQKQSIESLLRVQDFVARSGLSDASAEAARLVREFDEVVGRCQRATSHQVYGIRAGRACTHELHVAERRLRERHLRPLSRIAQAANEQETGLSQVFRMPRRRLPITMLVGTAGTMRTLAEQHSALFRRYGRNAEFLSELDAAIDAVKVCVSRRNRAEQLQVGATAAIAVHLSEARAG